MPLALLFGSAEACGAVRTQVKLLVQLEEFDLAVREAKEAFQQNNDQRLLQARPQPMTVRYPPIDLAAKLSATYLRTCRYGDDLASVTSCSSRRGSGDLGLLPRELVLTPEAGRLAEYVFREPSTACCAADSVVEQSPV